MMIITILTKY